MECASLLNYPAIYCFVERVVHMGVFGGTTAAVGPVTGRSDPYRLDVSQEKLHRVVYNKQREVASSHQLTLWTYNALGPQSPK